MTVNKNILIGVVGPCGSGKTTLTDELNSLGYITRHIAQEHSYVKDMWRRITNPDILIYLQASFPVTKKRRRKMINWGENEYREQLRRLSHAREHADLIIDTNSLSVEEVLESTLQFIEQK